MEMSRTVMTWRSPQLAVGLSLEHGCAGAILLVAMMSISGCGGNPESRAANDVRLDGIYFHPDDNSLMIFYEGDPDKACYITTVDFQGREPDPGELREDFAPETRAAPCSPVQLDTEVFGHAFTGAQTLGGHSTAVEDSFAIRVLDGGQRIELKDRVGDSGVRVFNFMDD